MYKIARNKNQSRRTLYVTVVSVVIILFQGISIASVKSDEAIKYLYLTEFSVDKNDAKNGRPNWLLSGDWRNEKSLDKEDEQSSNGFLVLALKNNKKQKSLQHLATQTGYLEIPSGINSVSLTIHHALQISDKATARIQIRTKHNGQKWKDLQEYTTGNNSDKLKTEQFSLDEYRGRSIKVRFVYISNEAEDIANWYVDRLAITATQSTTILATASSEEYRSGNDNENANQRPKMSSIQSVVDKKEGDENKGQLESDRKKQDSDKDSSEKNKEIQQENKPDDIVTGVRAILEQSVVELRWDAVDDEDVAYNVYRQENETAIEKLTAAPIKEPYFADTTVTNSQQYQYWVTAIEGHEDEGPKSEHASIFVLFNYTSISDLHLSRNKQNIVLTWKEEKGFNYRVYRTEDGQASTLIATVDQNQFVDTSAHWNKTYTYQVNSLITALDSIANTKKSLEGPISSAVQLEALPPLSLQLQNASKDDTGTWEKLIVGANTTALTGTVSHAVGNVSVMLTDGNQRINAQSSNSEIKVVLPGTHTTLWKLVLSDTAFQDRTLIENVKLIADEVAPTVKINGGAQQSTSNEFYTINGSISDDRSGVKTISVTNQRSKLSLGVIRRDNNYSAEIPLYVGDNELIVTAIDQSGNKGNASISVTRSVPSKPMVYINQPQGGFNTNDTTLDVQGVVYTTQAPEKVRIMMGEKLQFAKASQKPGVYPFTFRAVALQPGDNRILVNVETPLGNNYEIVNVLQAPAIQKQAQPPVITVISPTGGSYISQNQLVITGTVRSDIGLSSITINDQPVFYNSQDNRFSSFTYTQDVSKATGEIGFIFKATDQLGIETTERIVVYRDDASPVLSISEPALFVEPTINQVTKLPLVLNGMVIDETLSGVSINNTKLGLVPGLEANSYNYSVALNLSPQQEQKINIKAWDKAGNRTEKTFIVSADIPAAIEVIVPKSDKEYHVTGQSSLVEIVARLLGNYTGYTVVAIVDDKEPVPLTIDAQSVTGAVAVNATDGQHIINLELRDSQDTVVSTQAVKIIIVNIDNLPLALERSEPKNGETGIEPNEFITMYFNKPIDPTKLQMELFQTVHGKTYDLSGNFGVTPLLAGNTTKLVEVHQDQEQLKGEWSFLPGNRMAAFYAEQDYAYNAELLAKIKYDGKLINTLQFKVRSLPTFVQGFAADSLFQPLRNIQVELPELNRLTVTDINGSFQFGFGDSAQQSLSGGRHKIVFNPKGRNPQYGEITTRVNVEEGRLNNVGITTLPILSSEIPYRHIESGQNKVILAQGELIFDLSNAQLEFPNGKNYGDVHAQFMPRKSITYNSQPAVTATWLFALQPAGIKLSGAVDLSMYIPPLDGSTEYAPSEGTLVLIVGFEATRNQLVPVGVGEVKNKRIFSVGKLRLKQLDYIGYALKDAKSILVMREYVNGSMDFESMVLELNTIVQNATR